MQIEFTGVFANLVTIAFVSAVFEAILYLAGRMTGVQGSYLGYFLVVALALLCLWIPGWPGKLGSFLVFAAGLKRVTRASFFPDLILVVVIFTFGTLLLMMSGLYIRL
jgi:hypothetical protein